MISEFLVYLPKYLIDFYKLINSRKQKLLFDLVGIDIQNLSLIENMLFI